MSLTPPTHVRPIQPTDIEPLYRHTQRWFRVQWYATPGEERKLLQQHAGFLAEDSVGLRGFMLMIPQPAHFGLWVGLGLRDSWQVRPFLQHLLPRIEEQAHQQGLTAMMHLDYGGWCAPELPAFGFTLNDWLINYQCSAEVSPPLTPQTAHLRPATPSDAEGIMTLDQAIFPPEWHKPQVEAAFSFRPPHGVMVAEMAHHLAGYLWFERVEEWLHISRVGVLPTYQGRGIGGQLLRHVMLMALTEGVTRFTVNTLEGNRASRKLYERFGFQATGQRTPMVWKEIS